MLHPLQLVVVALAAAAGAAANSVGGGGSLITFPALVGLGVPPIAANATSTAALWPGSLSSMVGYRGALRGAAPWARRFALPNLAGGVAGALLLLATPAERFSRLVPWLVLAATALFVLQRPLLAALLRRRVRRGGGAPVPPEPAADPLRPPALPALAAQFAIAVYGGYFGAGAGIVTLASLGLMGLTDIHQMNGLKNWSAVCFNAAAIGLFAVSGVVVWPIAAAMSAGSLAGGYLAAGLAQRVPPAVVRAAVAVIGLGATAWLFAQQP
jgi:uncharacterized membrane protein YfcA